MFGEEQASAPVKTTTARGDQRTQAGVQQKLRMRFTFEAFNQRSL